MSVPIHVVDVEVFLRISDSFDLLVLLVEKFVDDQSQRGSSSGK